MQTGELYVYNLDNDEARFDTIMVKDGRFLYKGQAKSTVPYMLVFPNGVEQVIFAGPGTDLTYEATANDLKNYVVNGSEENKLMNEFRKQTYAMDAPRTTSAARSFINEHPESEAALYLLDKYFIQAENVSNAELSKLIKIVKQQHKNNHYLLAIENKIKAMGRCAEGMVVPDVALRPVKGKDVKLWDSKNKCEYNLITFWSMWSLEGYDMVWKMREFCNEYKGKGQLRIVSVSLDVERYRWEDVIKADSINGIEHYCDGKAFESDVVKKMGIESIPYYILADKNRKVVDRGTDMERLKKELDTRLKTSSEDKNKKSNNNLK